MSYNTSQGGHVILEDSVKDGLITSSRSTESRLWNKQEVQARKKSVLHKLEVLC